MTKLLSFTESTDINSVSITVSDNGNTYVLTSRDLPIVSEDYYAGAQPIVYQGKTYLQFFDAPSQVHPALLFLTGDPNVVPARYDDKQYMLVVGSHKDFDWDTCPPTPFSDGDGYVFMLTAQERTDYIKENLESIIGSMQFA